jgi:hypothetical protein
MPGMTSSGQPSRPYADPGQLGGNAPRSAEFTTGVLGDPGSTASVSSLNADADKFNALVPRQFEQHSVLQTAMPSANGMAAADYERMLPGLSKPLPSPNGSSQDSYQKSLLMRLSGQQDVI